MKLTVKNLGRIESAELDLRPLTMFVGKNGLNKTWAAYAACGGAASGSFEVMASVGGLENQWVTDTADPIVDAALRLEDGADLELFWRPTPQAMSADVGRFVEEITGHAPARTTLHVEQSPLFDASTIEVKRVGSSFRVTVTWTGPSVRRRRELLVERGSLPTLVRRLVAASVAPFHRTLFFPTERSWISQAPLATDAELQPVMIRAGLRYAALAKERMRQGSIEHDDPVLRIALGKLVGGTYTLDLRGVRFREGDIDLSLEAAASMIRSMALLALCLQSICRPGDVLVIDEPELNAHPEAQLGILELLAILANRGYHVIFTTHSPYLQDHLDNLMEASKLPADAPVPDSFALGMREAFLDPENVAAYEFVEQGERVVVRDALDRIERTTTSQTFAEVTDRLGRAMNQVLDLEESVGG